MLQTKSTAKITAKYSDSNDRIALEGVNSQENNENNAAAQINKILYFVGKEVVADGMSMTLTKEAVEDE